jgi:1-acyl-sn-glycerol-3-phosphate acyltransferase
VNSVLSRRLTISYQITKTLIRIVMLFLTRVTVRGIERVPRSGAAVIVSNHLAAVDPAILVAVLPRPVTLMSKIEVAHGLLKFFLWLVGAFTVRRGKVDRQALRTAQRVLAEGRLLGMFPEGTRSPQLGAGHGGAVVLALKSGAPIVPVALTDTSRVFMRQFPWLGFPHLTVTIGEPFYLRAPGSASQRADRDQMTTEIMNRIAALLPPDLRGNYRATGNA